MQIASAAGFTVERERALPSVSTLRQADILIHAWQAGKGGSAVHLGTGSMWYSQMDCTNLKEDPFEIC